MSFQQFPTFLTTIFTRRIDGTLRRCYCNRGVFSPLIQSIRTQSTGASLKVDHNSDVSTLRNWTRIYPFLPSTNPSISKNVAKHDLDDVNILTPKQVQQCEPLSEERQAFIEKYLSQELAMDPVRVKKIYFLCKDHLNVNYPTNESFIQLCSFLKLFFTSDDLYYNPKPFMIPPNELYNKIMLLKEFGFRDFNCSMIESIHEYLHLTTYTLNQHFNYLGKHSCFDALCKALDIAGKDKEKLANHILAHHGEIDSLTLLELRTLCTIRYLSKVLNISEEQVDNTVKRASRVMSHVSLHTIKQNVNYLLKEFRYSSSKILHNCLFAKLDPLNLEKFSTLLKAIVGARSFQNAQDMVPILKCDFNQIRDNFLLIKRKCNDKFFSRSFELLKIPHEELNAIFTEIESNKDIQQLNLSILGVDYLAMHLNTILKRIQKIKDEQLPLDKVPLSFFLASDTEFTYCIEDIIFDPEMRIRFYLETVLKMDYSKIQHRIKVIPGVNAEKFDKKNAKKITEFLISMNIPKETIIDNIYVILFEYKLVKAAYSSACSRIGKSLYSDPKFFQHIFDLLLAEN